MSQWHDFYPPFRDEFNQPGTFIEIAGESAHERAMVVSLGNDEFQVAGTTTPYAEWSFLALIGRVMDPHPSQIKGPQ